MVTTHFLLKPNFNSSSLLQRTFHLPPVPRSFPTKWPCARDINYSSDKVIRVLPKFRIKCFVMDHKPEEENGIVGNKGGEDHDSEKVAVDNGIIGVSWRSKEDGMKALQVPFATGVLVGSLLLYDHHHARLALAASGGRMGGRSSSSSRSSSRSSSTRSSSSRRSSSTPSYSSSGSYNSLTSSPESSSETSRTQTSSPTSSSETYKLYTTQTNSPIPTKSEHEPNLAFCLFLLTLLVLLRRSDADENTIKTSVLKLQIGLLGTARSLQGELTWIAEAADTSTSKGLNYLLHEAILALLRHPDYCISGYSSVNVKNKKEGEKLFNQLSLEERGKFDEETLVNVNNIRSQSATSQISNGLHNEYIVVTIIVATSGKLKLPPIKSIAQLKKALQNVASIRTKDLRAVEVLWTPQQENDSLTEQEYFQNYPLLHQL